VERSERPELRSMLQSLKIIIGYAQYSLVWPPRINISTCNKSILIKKGDLSITYKKLRKIIMIFKTIYLEPVFCIFMADSTTITTFASLAMIPLGGLA
jgi:hypothetical protein